MFEDRPALEEDGASWDSTCEEWCDCRCCLSLLQLLSTAFDLIFCFLYSNSARKDDWLVLIESDHSLT